MITETEELERRKQRCDNSKMLDSSGNFILAILLGISTLIMIIFMAIYLALERIGVVPIIALFTIDGFNAAETVIVFVIVVILTLFVIILALWFAAKSVRKKKCERTYKGILD